MRQLDLSVAVAQRTMVKKVLTTCMRDRLKDKEADYNKVRKRDCNNALLADKIDGLVKEEVKSTSSLKQVRKLDYIGKLTIKPYNLRDSCGQGIQG